MSKVHYLPPLPGHVMPTEFSSIMAPILHCVRHAQGYHNLGVEYHGIQDPKLTPLGQEQCLALRAKHFPDQSKISLVTASPLARTLHTADITFKPALEGGIAKPTILAIPDAQETSDHLCDTGSDVPVLEAKCEEHKWPVDLHLVKDGWNVKTLGNRYSPAATAISSRARDARRLIREKMRELIEAGNPDPEIVLVAHGGYLHYFTEDWENSNKLLGTGWENCETRAYTFEHGVESEEPNAHLVETTESRQSRGLSYPMFSKDQQASLYVQSMQNWENQGLQNASKLGISPSVVEEVTPLAKIESNTVKVAA